MSFNLNKNDGPKQPSKKSSFDLSKSDTEVPSDEQAPVRSPGSGPNWRYILLALVIIGAASWYFTRHTADTKVADTSEASAGNSAQTDTAAKDSSATASSPAGSQPASTADSATNASAGTTQPTAIDPKSGIASGGETLAKPQTAENAPAEIATRVAASFTAGSSHPGSITGSLPALMRKKLKTNKQVIIYVLGYASSEGNPEINQQISQARADAYKRLLVQKGIAENNINAQGKGIENPIATNDTDAGRKKNRRVEVYW